MRKITILLMSMLLSVTTAMYAQCPRATIVSSDVYACTDGVITLTATGVAPTDYAFEWSVGGGTIVYGAGTASIGVKWGSSGSKGVSVSYKDLAGCDIKGSVAITVKSGASVPAITIAETTLCEDAVLSLGATPSISNPDNIYQRGRWTLNGADFDPTRTLNRFDDGKLLRYEFKSNTAACNDAKSMPVQLTIEDKPLIKSVTINGSTDVPASVEPGTKLTFAVVATQSKYMESKQALKYVWFNGNDTLAKTASFVYTVKDKDPIKSVSVKVSNTCGSVISERTVAQGTKDLVTAGSPFLQPVVATPKDFFVRSTTATDGSRLPDKYWENTNYKFYTTNSAKYTNGGEAWFNRTSVDDQWVESPKGVGYKFVVHYMVTDPVFFQNPMDMLDPMYGIAEGIGIWQRPNTTILLDEGIYIQNFNDSIDYICPVNDFTIPGFGPTPLKRKMASTTGASDIFEGQPSCKIFGLRNVVLKLTNVKAANYLSIHTSNDNVLENITIDASGGEFDLNHMMYVRGSSRLVLKDINITNAKLANTTSSPKGFLTIATNKYSTTGKSLFQVYAEGINIDPSCAYGAGGAVADALLSGIYVNQSDGIYLKDITVGIPATADYQHSVLFGRLPIAATTAGRYTPNTDVVISNLKTVSDDIYMQRWDHKNIAISGDYRYIKANPNNAKYANATTFDGSLVSTFEFSNSLPAFTDSTIIYDRVDGYWVVSSSDENVSSVDSIIVQKQLHTLADFYAKYKAANTGAPLPNVKVVANEDGTIRPFEVPTLGVSDQINLVIVESATSTVGQSQYIPYERTAQKIRVTGTDLALVNIYNIDFAAADYSSTELIDNTVAARLGNFYNCKVTDYTKNGAYLAINVPVLGIDELNNGKATIYPNPVVNQMEVCAESDIQSVVVRDLSGRIVYSTSANSTCVTIPAASWSAGTYLVTVATANGQNVQKIIKK